ncbi:MAG: DUF58 domain-containing protein [Mariprofundus sp.]|nr:DUF58 domain-containing protein [Mariprofundus sp.]
MQRSAATLRLREGYPRALMAGAHLSRFQGRGVEFDEVRPYQPGDEIRNMDWRVTARTGKPHIKLFREERERPALLLLDLRPSMFFATQGALKAVVASECASLLAWSVVHQGDRIGSMLLDAGDQSVPVRPARGKRSVMRMLGQIIEHPQWRQRLPDSGASLLPFLQRASHAARSGSLILIVSDGRGLDDAAQTRLKLLLKHHQIVFVMIYDPFEVAMPDAGMLHAFDGARVRQINAADASVRHRLANQFEARKACLQELEKLPGFFLIACATTDDPFTALQARLGVTR